MVSSNAVVLCTYSYDPLDRLVAASPAESDSVQRFYQKSRLTTEIQGQIQRAVFQSEGHLLARQQLQSGQTDCALLGTDQQRSVLHSLDPAQQRAFAYAPYGFRPPQLDLPGFNGEQPDPVTGDYLLGNGYRAFNPVLMRFNSPDSLSPFGDGGLNAYAYCGGDPVNRVDPTGHTNFLVKFFLSRAGFMSRSRAGSVAAVGRLPPSARTLPASVDRPPSNLEARPVSGAKAVRLKQILSDDEQSLKIVDARMQAVNSTRGEVIIGPGGNLRLRSEKLSSQLKRQDYLRKRIASHRDALGMPPAYNYDPDLPSYFDAIKAKRVIDPL